MRKTDKREQTDEREEKAREIKRGKFVTFEGCEGCGKSTQLALFDEYLTKQQIPHIFTREPGGGKISEAIRNILLDVKNKEMTDECEALLYAAARAQHLAEVVEPALAAGKTVICDRYVDSSFAYQAYARGLGEQFVAGINAYAMERYLPDLTVLIDLSPEDAFRRKHGADANDRVEQAGGAFHRKVYEGYLALAEKYPQRIVRIDGKNSPEGIFQSILVQLRERNIL